MTDEKPGDPLTEESGPDEFPDSDELPEEPLSVDEMSPFEVEPADFDDINDFAKAEWVESTTARDRVQDVIKRAASPKTAGDIAAIAEVSTTTARKKLNDLAAEGTVLAERTDNGKLYQRDPDWYLMQRVQRLAKSDSLVDQIQNLQQELAEYRDTYGTDMPEEVLVSDGDLSEAELEEISQWRTAMRDLTFLRAAYRFREARECATNGSQKTRQDDTRVSPL